MTALRCCSASIRRPILGGYRTFAAVAKAVECSKVSSKLRISLSALSCSALPFHTFNGRLTGVGSRSMNWFSLLSASPLS